MELCKKCLAPLLFLFSMSCVVPVRNTYIYLERPEAIHSKDNINGSPAIIYFEFHRIWLSATIQPSFIQLGIHVPEGQTAQVEMKTLEITQSLGTESVKNELELIPVPGDYKNVTAVNFLIGYKHDFSAEEHFKTLSGGTIVLNYPLSKNIICHKGYFFKIPFSLPKSSKGLLRFPNLNINGTSYPGPILPFTEKKELVPAYFGP
jgi:hypothetical protein